MIKLESDYLDFQQHILEASLSDKSDVNEKCISSNNPVDTTEPFTKHTLDVFEIRFDYKIKKLRAVKDISQEKLALDLGVHVNTVKLWERESNNTYLSHKNLIKLCAYFKKTPDYFLVPIDKSFRVDSKTHIKMVSKRKEEFENIILDYVFETLVPYNINEIDENDFNIKHQQHLDMLKNHNAKWDVDNYKRNSRNKDT